MAIPAPVEDAVEAQLEALRKVAPRHRDLILDAYKEAGRKATEALEGLPPGSFTAQRQRQILAGARTVVVGLEGDLEDALKQIGTEGSAIGRDGLLDQINAWRGHFTGTTRRINPVERTADLLDEGLLEFYEVSRKTYGDDAIKRMRRAMALASAEGLTVAESIDRIASAAEIPAWKAERIARTEGSFAAHRRQVQDMTESEEGELWVKELVTSFDNRTGDDSKRVDGQQRPMGEKFTDPGGELDPFEHPPNRPNDRETMVMVPSEDEPAPGTARLDSLIDSILKGEAVEEAVPETREPKPEPGPRADVLPRPMTPGPFNTGQATDPAKMATAAQTISDRMQSGRPRRKADRQAEETLRRELNSLVSAWGLVPESTQHKGKGWQKIQALRSKTAAGQMGWNGTMKVQKTTIARATRALEAKIAGKPLDPKEAFRLKTLIHETIHATGGIQPTAFRGAGMVMEEAITEAIAQRVTKAWANPPASMFLSYQGLIDGVEWELSAALRRAGEVVEGAQLRERFTDAAIRVKQNTDRLVTPEDMAGKLADSLRTKDGKQLPSEERARLKKELGALRASLLLRRRR